MADAAAAGLRLHDLSSRFIGHPKVRLATSGRARVCSRNASCCGVLSEQGALVCLTYVLFSENLWSDEAQWAAAYKRCPGRQFMICPYAPSIAIQVTLPMHTQ